MGGERLELQVDDKLLVAPDTDAESLAVELTAEISAAFLDLGLADRYSVAVTPIPVEVNWAGDWLAIRVQIFGNDGDPSARFAPSFQVAEIVINQAWFSRHKAPGIRHPTRLRRDDAIVLSRWLAARASGFKYDDAAETTAMGSENGWIVEVHGSVTSYAVSIPAGKIDERRIIIVKAPPRRPGSQPKGAVLDVCDQGRETFELDAGEMDTAAAELVHEINESLAELGLDKSYRFQATAGPHTGGYADWSEITWQLMSVVGSGALTNAAYDVAKLFVMRRLSAARGARGLRDSVSGTRDEVVAIAKLAVTEQYGLEPLEMTEIGEQRTSNEWIVELRYSNSTFRVVIPHGETRCSKFHLSRTSGGRQT